MTETTKANETQAPETEKAKRFTIYVENEINGKEETFTFSGPSTAPLGLIYDVSHMVLMKINSIIQEKSESLKPVSKEKKLEK